MRTDSAFVYAKLDHLLRLKKQALGFKLKETNRQAYTGRGYTKSPFKSKGLDFQEVRAYQPGDDIRQIDWRVTAKYGKPFTKLYTDEKERQVFLICDMRSRMKFASRGRFKSVVAAYTAALLSYLAENKSDRLGFTVLTAEQIETTKAYGANEVLNGLLHTLETASDPLETASDQLSLHQALQKSTPLVRAGSLVFILSDFSDWTPACESILRRWAQKSTCGLIHIYDELEKHLPSGIFPISDGREITLIDTKSHRFQTDYADVFLKREEALKSLARNYDIGYLPVRTDEDIISKVFAYCVGEKNNA